MPAFLPYEGNIKNLSSFLKDSRDNLNLYMGLSRTTAWAIPASPPYITDTQEEKEDFWNELVTIERISQKDIIPIVPLRTWTNDTSYVVFDSTDADAFDSAFYVTTSNDEVFTCKVAGSGTSIDEPEKTSLTNGVYLASDDYEWTYQYTCNSYELSKVSTGWLPVSYYDIVDSTDSDANAEALRELGTRYLMIIGILDGSDLTSAPLTYRQVGLISEPLLATAVDGSFVPTLERYDKADLELESGYLTFLENRVAQTMTALQTTENTIILRF